MECFAIFPSPNREPLWYTIVYYGLLNSARILWYTMIYCDILWYTVVYCGIL